MSGFTARLHLHGMQVVATRRTVDPPGSDADSWSAIVRMGGPSLALSAAVLSDTGPDSPTDAEEWWAADTAEYPVVGEDGDEG
jgi:hypothetical protein